MSVSARLAIGVMKAIAHLPLPVLRGVGAGLGHVLHALARPRRHVVDANLRMCFPDLSDDERTRDEFEVCPLQQIERGGSRLCLLLSVVPGLNEDRRGEKHPHSASSMSAPARFSSAIPSGTRRSAFSMANRA